MSHAHPEGSSIVIHRSGFYDFFAGRFVRRSDGPMLARAEYQVASAESLPFEDRSFDVAASRLVLHHLPGDLKLRALVEVRRVLRPGGRLLVADMASPAAKGAHHLAAHLLGTHPEPEDALERLVWDAGFRQITSGKLMHGMLLGVAARSPEPGAQA
jgi:ubiquinone/menaquinone biosynthesis C-methylase UbiE